MDFLLEVWGFLAEVWGFLAEVWGFLAEVWGFLVEVRGFLVESFSRVGKLATMVYARRKEGRSWSSIVEKWLSAVFDPSS